MASDRFEILGQFEYLADELEAQRAVIGWVPESLWDARSPVGDESLSDLYAVLAERIKHRDRLELAPWLGEPVARSSGTMRGRPSREVLPLLATDRRRLVGDLTALDEDVWSQAVDGQSCAQVVYALIQSDTALLRRIVERLFEGGMR